MKKVLVLIVLSVLSISWYGQLDATKNFKRTNVIPASVDSSDWVTLFDGTSFEHWRGYNSEEMPSGWAIEDDAMVLTPIEGSSQNIITKKEYTNFILSMDWKISEGGNSGVFWGVFEDEKFHEPYQTGPEIQVIDNDNHPDAILGEGTHSAGSLYDMVGPSKDVVNPANEWNHFEIVINHHTNQGSVSLNGEEIAVFPVNGKAWDTMVAKSKFKNWKDFGKYPTGHIGLQDHGNKVGYRNIKIKELDK